MSIAVEEARIITKGKQSEHVLEASTEEGINSLRPGSFAKGVRDTVNLLKTLVSISSESPATKKAISKGHGMCVESFDIRFVFMAGGKRSVADINYLGIDCTE